MADTNLLKVEYIFEAGSRLRCDAEVMGLAAHLYHKFFRMQDMNQFDLYTFGSACIKLARHFYDTIPTNGSSRRRSAAEDCSDIALVMVSIVHGNDEIIGSRQEEQLARSINFASQIIAINLNFQINYRDTRRMTPGDMMRSSRGLTGENDNCNSHEIESSDDEYYDRDVAEELLFKNSKYTISSHRYLTHYLKSIELLIHPESVEYFRKLSNVAWIILNDFHWSSRVTQHLSHHLACASLMMAVESCRKELDTTKSAKAHLWELVNKKWNLIFCDDFNNQELERTIITIIKQYSEYERLHQHEFNTCVIDPQNTSHGVP